MKKLISQIVKFGVVGVSAFFIDYSIMIVLTELLKINYLISSGISFSVSVIFNYILSVYWVFEVEKNKREEFTVFLVLSLIGLGINQLIMWIVVSNLHIFYMLAKIFATCIVMVYNFITRKIFLEKWYDIGRKEKRMSAILKPYLSYSLQIVTYLLQYKERKNRNILL